MPENEFMAEDFYSALESRRIAQKKTWKKVAEEACVSASTLTRMGQGRRPDVDSLAALIKWSGLKIEDFIVDMGPNVNKVDALTRITTHLRADPNLSPESAKALETLVKVTYERMIKR